MTRDSLTSPRLNEFYMSVPFAKSLFSAQRNTHSTRFQQSSCDPEVVRGGGDDDDDDDNWPGLILATCDEREAL